METVLALLVGVMFGAAVYALLRGTLLRLVVGVILFTASVNLMIFTVGGLVRDNPPLVAAGAAAPARPHAPALPQALVLTAIVIGFGLVVFTLVLVSRAHEATGEADADRMRAALHARTDAEDVT